MIFDSYFVENNLFLCCLKNRYFDIGLELKIILIKREEEHSHWHFVYQYVKHAYY